MNDKKAINNLDVSPLNRDNLKESNLWSERPLLKLNLNLIIKIKWNQKYFVN
jgi:hypothetical protein